MTAGYNSDALHDLVPYVQFKKREINPWRGYLFVKFQALACSFTESISPPRVFFTFIKLYKWYKIAQSVSYVTLRSQFPIRRIHKNTVSPCERGIFIRRTTST